jgi:hypothetical protein
MTLARLPRQRPWNTDERTAIERELVALHSFLAGAVKRTEMVLKHFTEPSCATAEEDDDLIYGYRAIAQHLRVTFPQARYAGQTGAFPVFKVGEIVCARRSVLDRYAGTLAR